MATCETNLGELLLHAHLFPRILASLSTSDGLVVRLLSKDARQAHDEQATGLRLVVTSARTVEDVASAIRGILGRGCRPQCVTMDILGPEQRELSPEGLLLHTFAGEPSSTLELLKLPGVFLNEAVADLIASAFPRLQRLQVTGNPPRGAAPMYSAIKLLLSREGSTLTEVDLFPHSLHKPTLPQAAGAAFAGAVQLRKLMTPFFLNKAKHAQPFSDLRSLEALSIGHCWPNLLQPLLSPLTALTSLNLGTTEVREQDHMLVLVGLRSLEALTTGGWEPSLLPPLLSSLTALTSLDLGRTVAQLPSALTGLSRLVSLAAAPASLAVDTLSRLSALTKLHVECLVLPSAAEVGAQWQLPPKLEAVRLDEQAPEVLHALRGSLLRVARWELGLYLKHGKHWHEQDGGNALLEEGEAALCSAAGFLEGRMSEDSAVRAMIFYNCALLLPVGGKAEVGPGRRNHTAWLNALSRAGVPSLELLYCNLSYQDLAAITRNTRLKALDLITATYPDSALLLLPDAPRLETVTLDMNPWIDDGGPSAELRVVLLALLRPGRITVVMDCTCGNRDETAALIEQVPRLRADAVSRVCRSLLESYELVYSTVEDPTAGYVEQGGTAAIKHTPQQVKTILGVI